MASIPHREKTAMINSKRKLKKMEAERILWHALYFIMDNSENWDASVCASTCITFRDILVNFNEVMKHASNNIGRAGRITEKS
jgi:hypothetical protein